ncbi:response regulator [Agromyces luteolus]|uniref:Response regulator n=1 Tax=Agromyces luteolus TaxID=88373 RepID=A0A7C9LYW2_9MICO|nr:response regulator [Agromyces luteolus]MUN09039.1 response regulator [Agromyces luteolus]GLK28728.1 response regulator [Agromyces luteolus]
MDGRRVLVVEDNQLNLKLVRDVLSASGFEIVEAHTGEEGVELAASCAPDLVLMDLQLPGIDGYEALRRLRLDPRFDSVPVVAVTAFAMKEDRDRTAREGFDGYLVKPISVPALPSQVGDFLDRGRTNDR